MGLMRKATSDIKMWEGRELERAYKEAPLPLKMPQLLMESTGGGVNDWLPADKLDLSSTIPLGSSTTTFLPWKPADPHFEHAWFLQASLWDGADPPLEEEDT